MGTSRTGVPNAPAAHGWPRTGASPWPERRRAAQQRVSGAQVSQASSARAAAPQPPPCLPRLRPASRRQGSGAPGPGATGAGDRCCRSEGAQGQARASGRRQRRAPRRRRIERGCTPGARIHDGARLGSLFYACRVVLPRYSGRKELIRYTWKAAGASPPLLRAFVRAEGSAASSERTTRARDAAHACRSAMRSERGHTAIRTKSGECRVTCSVRGSLAASPARRTAGRGGVGGAQGDPRTCGRVAPRSVGARPSQAQAPRPHWLKRADRA